MSSIHTLERASFPVLNEPFLVDKNYEYVKELGQGKSSPPPLLIIIETKDLHPLSILYSLIQFYVMNQQVPME